MKSKKGFTLLEVALTVAIATLLFISVTVGLSRRVAYGRYETGANELVDFLRKMYTSAMNTEIGRQNAYVPAGGTGSRSYCTLYGATAEGAAASQGRGNTLIGSDTDDHNTNPGRSGCAVYGKVLFFGGQKDGDDIVYAFDIVGDAIENSSELYQRYYRMDGYADLAARAAGVGNILEQLKAVNADYLAVDSTATGCKVVPASDYTSYRPSWGIRFKTGNGQAAAYNNKNLPYIAAVAFVRSPADGTMTTIYWEKENPAPDTAAPSTDRARFDFSSIISGSEDISCASGASGDYISFGTSRGSSDFLDLTAPETDQTFAITEDEACNAKGEDVVAGESCPGSSPSVAKFYDDISYTGTKNTGFCIASDDFLASIMSQRKFVMFKVGGQNPSTIKFDESGANPCV